MFPAVFAIFIHFSGDRACIKDYVFIDPFGGSGSTLIACEQTDRICYAIELDEKFCDVIVKRYIEQVGSDEKVSVLRDGKEYKYSEVAPHDE